MKLRLGQSPVQILRRTFYFSRAGRQRLEVRIIRFVYSVQYLGAKLRVQRKPFTENSGDAQVQSIDTVDNISVNKQRQVPRTSTAPRHDLGCVSYDGTQDPMIHKVQKTVEIVQVQFIDKMVEISEIMLSKNKCQRSRRNGNSRKLTDKIVYVPVVLKRQCQPSESQRQVQKDPNVSPQPNQRQV